MKPAPAFQFYVADFIEGTSNMTNAEVGVYIRLLCAQWTRGGLPNDDKELMRFCGGAHNVAKILPSVRQKFALSVDGKLRNQRLEIERAKQEAYRAAQAVKGQQSGISRRAPVQPRFNPGSGSVQSGSPPVRTQREPEGNSLSSSSVFKEEKKEPPNPHDEKNGIVEVESLLSELGKLFNKPPGERNTDPEIYDAAMLIRERGDRLKEELKLIVNFRRCMNTKDAKFFPRSRLRLLQKWQDILDEARGASAPDPDPDLKKFEKQIDRWMKTPNEIDKSDAIEE